jgi:hypothetical protein
MQNMSFWFKYICEIDYICEICRLKPIVSISARDTVHPVREIHSTTPVWPGADYTLPIGVGIRRLRGETGGGVHVPSRLQSVP